jgi:nucleotide-binding universal stress UspA family protein
MRLSGLSALKRILVATDFSDTADAALKYGRALADNFGATLHVLHVADDFSARMGDTFLAVMPELVEDVAKDARRRLSELVVDNELNPSSVVPVVITASSPAVAIVDYANDKGIDLIVLGTQGRGGVAQLLMGSVAERVVRTARCPVLTVRHPAHDFVGTNVSNASAQP